MKNYTKHLLSLAILFGSLNAMAQNSSINKADDLYKRLQFMDAAALYETGLTEIFYLDPANKLANCYFQIGDMAKAEFWYGQVVIEKNGDAAVHLNYARALQANGKYDLAAQQYEKYNKINPIDGLGRAGMQACKDAKDLEARPISYKIRPLIINSRGSDMSPAYYGDGIIFASTRTRRDMRELENGYDLNNYYDLYTTKPNETGEWGVPEVMKSPLNTIYHEGPVALNPDEDVMVFTTTQYIPDAIHGSLRKSKEPRVANLKLMITTKNAFGRWSKPKNVPFNSVDFSSAHPTFSNDGEFLYFVSDRIEGKGGTDLYIIKYDGDNKWGEPINIDFLNTAGDEMFPAMDASGDLFFASNGHPGLGGLDVFRAFFNSERRKFDDIMNMGPPVNTRYDDFGFLQDRKGINGFVSSNRPNGFGSDDIYGLVAEAAVVRVKVQDSETDAPIVNAEVEVSLGDKAVGKATTTGNGSFNFPFEPNQTYTLTVQADEFRGDSYDFTTPNLVPGQVYKRNVSMMPEKMVLIKGLIIEDQSKLPVTGSTIKLYNLDNGNIRTVKSDGKGLFKQEVKPGVNYALVGYKDGYDADSLIIDTKGLNTDEPIARTLTLSEGERVYSVSFTNVYFDYNSASLKAGDKSELDKMVEIMKLSPALRVEISAHTDSRGPNDFNMGLSDRRAKAVVNYLASNGISKDRIKPKGYGETKLANGCKDEVPCTEAQHKINRRVEFRVLDENDEVIYQSIK